MRTTTSMLLLAAAVLIHWQEPRAPQDPVKPEKPAATTADPTSDTKAKAPAAERVIPGKPERHRFEGVYRLVQRVVAGTSSASPKTGYLAITGHHLFLDLAAPGADPEYPLLNAGVREWRETREGVRTVVLLEHYTDGAGVIHAVPNGKEEVRLIEPVRGGLRLVQGDRTWLEFERIE